MHKLFSIILEHWWKAKPAPFIVCKFNCQISSWARRPNPEDRKNRIPIYQKTDHTAD